MRHGSHTSILGQSPFTKRAIDIVGAAAALAVGALPLGLASIVIRATMGRPVLFRQQRPGREGRLFTLTKLRTMREDTRAPVTKESIDIDGRVGEQEIPRLGGDAARLTRLGRFLRATSIDELPELVLVLTGKMSLVGPRPLLSDYLEFYIPDQARRHEVRPGVTGLAQVCGRNELSWEERFALDVWYVDNWTVALDLAILARTIFSVVRRRGISAPGEATMTPFSGNTTPPREASPT